MKINIIRILGINFFNGHMSEVVNTLKSDGLLVVPSGPSLASINNEPTYYQSLQQADIVIADSGFMVLLWNISHREKVNRISGLEFLNNCFADQDFKINQEMMLVNPRQNEADANISFLQKNGFNLSEQNSYIAPIYNKSKIEDEKLLHLLAQKKPKYIIINLAGGIQEILGAYLKKNLSYKPAIICTGAAISFLTGKQVQIPNWADRFFLGWLFRCLDKPRLYIPRYLSALKLILVMFQYSDHSQISLSIE